VIGQAYLAQTRDRTVDLWFLFPLLVQPVIFASMAVVLFQRTGGQQFVLFGIIGSGLIGLWNTNIWSSGWIIETERWEGTLELLMATPALWEDVLIGKSLANASLSAASMGIVFAVATYAFRVPIVIKQPLAFGVSLALTVAALTCLGLLLGALFVLSRAANRAGEVLNYPIFILSGMFFPLTVLPLWTRPLSLILAPTWSAQGLRWGVGIPTGWPVVEHSALVTLALLYYLIARPLYQTVERKVRAEGTLGHH
jgi:ABC-2 type transport system permease protein